jgi:CO/xanthine dehydrogenase Mo-binding subunit
MDRPQNCTEQPQELSDRLTDWFVGCFFILTIRVRAVAAVDCGRTINPDGVSNQVEGGIVQAVSWVLKEQVRFDRTRITTRTWDDYPILRFSESPAVEVSIIDRPDEPSLGVGEAVAGPVAAAIANAVFDAIGVRVRDLPFTRERMLAAINDT